MKPGTFTGSSGVLNKDATYATDAHSISFTEALLSCKNDRQSTGQVGSTPDSLSHALARIRRTRCDRRAPAGPRFRAFRCARSCSEAASEFPEDTTPSFSPSACKPGMSSLLSARSAPLSRISPTAREARALRHRWRGRQEDASHYSTLLASRAPRRFFLLRARTSLSFGVSWQASSYTPYLSYTGIWMCLSWWRAADPR